MRCIPLALILSLIVISSCTRGSDERVTTSEPRYIQDLSHASAKIKDTKEFENCITPTVNMCINQVANDLARREKTTSFCDELSEGSSRDACRYGVVLTEAIDKNDLTLCGTLPHNYKNDCSITLNRLDAINSGDIKKCDRLELSGSTLPERVRVDQCRLDVIMKLWSKDGRLCEMIDDEVTRNMCTSLVRWPKWTDENK
jgi:hypothetical protein